MTFQKKPSSGHNRSHVALTLDRRGFLTVGATLGAGLLLPELTGCSPGDDDNPQPVVNEELFTPASVRSRDGVLDIELTITETEVTVGQYTFMTRAYTGLKVNRGESSFGDATYTGTVPGPSIELRPGDQLKLKLINHLPDDSSAVDPPDCAMGGGGGGGGHGHGAGTHNNTTNLHTHGLHVDPGPPGDDVFLAIGPGESYDFVFDIPRDIAMPDGTKANHPAGTYWYHPHMHGSTAIQVAGGMVGAIIIRDEERDDLDRLFSPEPGPGQGKEQLLVVGEYMIQTKDSCDGKTRLATYGEMGHAGPLPPGVEDFFHINGQLNPVIRMRPSEVQRFRLLHTGFRAPLDVAFLRVPDDQVDPATSLPKPDYDPFGYSCASSPMVPPVLNRDELRAKSATYYQVATDGITYGAPLKMPLANPVSEVEYVIPPGGRVDMLVQFEAGTYQMVALGYPDFVCWGPQVLATVVVSGEPDTSLQIPQVLTPPALYPPFDDTSKPGNEVTNTRQLEFAVTLDNAGAAHFTIDGRTFCMGRVDQCVLLGAVEEWTIINKVTPKAGATVHPFHIHVNSFLVTSINGKSPSQPIWRDTCIIPTNGPADGSLTFLSRFLHFKGPYVLHCHILEHEDEGMMQLVEVQEAACPAPPVDDTCEAE
ncbi:Multicopper oxidase with three cupredoxin domains (includes cell division protein FtsP and spore coat protein CotA) [Nannocystis exedens]|uniref:Multicopper oxidase with three cupredoxin domains (Includes cell division protein FtsP and spore coat protein CotA) n=1 Tax=Nannocystis exedens TaxID=54 RepID=A0A1I2AQI9_9BACT|nr:multicopper oxidase domain-containing protein [Nannocystis exedens]PCC74195.1 multicopper oxidase [Nannocystis exedens]SFE45848.1 Multicopper oxidase with three cupredoxin domains (includes cell division protein FtsP and spore coat protein CotA) [Nannocystis exedens]